MLPLAITASAVLLLGSASLHTLSLQKRLRINATLQREQVADQLRSSAQAFVVASRGPDACLLRWPSFEWSGGAQACSGSDPSRLSAGVVGEMPWSLLDWQPRNHTGQLRLRIHSSNQREQGADQLRSAAQAFVVSARGPEACLLQWSSLDWPGFVHGCSGSDPSRL